MELQPSIDALREVLTGRPEVRFALLYGSAAEGREARDIDVGVLVDRSVVPRESDLAYGARLEAELRRAARADVDLRLLNDAPLALRYNASRGIALVENQPNALADFREDAWRRFLDFKPTAEAFLRELA